VSAKGPFIAGQVLVGNPEPEELLHLTDTYRLLQRADVGLGVTIFPQPDSLSVFVALITPHGAQQYSRSYGGPTEYASFWAFNQCLDLLRRIPNDKKS
jgi:hypothetical protein